MNDPLSFHIAHTTVPARPVYPTRKLLKPSSDHPDDYILELDYSSLSKFIECARSGENYLVRSREADRPSSATDFGKLFHTCEELRLEHGLTDAVIQRQRELVADHFIRFPVSPTDHRTATRMRQVLDKYNALYVNDGLPHALLQHEGAPFVERPFKIELCTVEVNGTLPYDGLRLVAGVTSTNALERNGDLRVRNIHCVYTGRIDAIVEVSSMLWVLDHKTSSRGGKELEDYFFLSLQTRGYVWAAQRILGRTVAGFMLNAVIVKPPTAKLENNTDFDRRFYPYTADLVDEWEDNMRALFSDVITCLIRGFWPQTSRSFKSPCNMCDYHENCQLPRSARPADLASTLYRDVTWTPINE